MNVLIVTNLYPNPLQPGRASWNRQQFRALAARQNVRVLAPILWTDERSAGRLDAAFRQKRQAVCDGIAVEHPTYYYPPKVLRGQYGRFFYWSVRRSFSRMVRQLRPDVVLGSWAYPDGWASVCLARRFGIPAVIKAHGSDVLGLTRHPGRLRATVRAMREADAVVAVSRDLAAKITALGVPDEKVKVVYNGLDTEVFKPGPRSDARRRLGLPPGVPLILFVGGLVPVKQVGVLLEACARIRAAGRPFSCRIVGDGPLRASLARQVDEAGLSGDVRFEGERAHGELPDWYRSADVVALPSRSEGLPNVLLEAAACGTPFVASDVGGIPEVAAASAGRLVPPGDASALADGLVQALDRRDTLPPPAFGSAAGPLRTWDASAAELEAVLAAVAARRGSDAPELHRRAR